MSRRLWQLFYRFATQALTLEVIVPYARVRTPRGRFKLFSPGAVPYARARALMIKERDTIEWINHFQPRSVFWDVGANIGSFSLYAAKGTGNTVLSFEPAAANYMALNKNIEANRLEDQIRAFAIAFFSGTELNHIHSETTSFGSALHTFASPTDWRGRPFEAIFRQAMIGFSIDRFVELFAPPFPNYIKVDVDGNELSILHGAEKTLADPRLRSVMVEIDPGRTGYRLEIVRCMEAAGLRLSDPACENDIGQAPLPGPNHFFRRSYR